MQAVKSDFWWQRDGVRLEGFFEGLELMATHGGIDGGEQTAVTTVEKINWLGCSLRGRTTFRQDDPCWLRLYIYISLTQL